MLFNFSTSYLAGLFDIFIFDRIVCDAVANFRLL